MREDEFSKGVKILTAGFGSFDKNRIDLIFKKLCGLRGEDWLNVCHRLVETERFAPPVSRMISVAGEMGLHIPLTQVSGAASGQTCLDYECPECLSWYCLLIPETANSSSLVWQCSGHKGNFGNLSECTHTLSLAQARHLYAEQVAQRARDAASHPIRTTVVQQALRGVVKRIDGPRVSGGRFQSTTSKDV